MPSDSDPGSVLQCATNKRHLGLTLTFLLVSFRLAVVWSPVHYQWNDTTVLFFSERGRNASERGRNASEKQAKTDGSGPPVVWRTRIICKNLGLKDMLDCFFGSFPVLQLRKCFWVSCVSFCLLKCPQICFKQSLKSWAKLWVGVLSHKSQSLNSPPWEKFVTDLTVLSCT